MVLVVDSVAEEVALEDAEAVVVDLMAEEEVVAVVALVVAAVDLEEEVEVALAAAAVAVDSGVKLTINRKIKKELFVNKEQIFQLKNKKKYSSFH